MKLIRLNHKNRGIYLQQILNLEAEATYPYGDHFFKIDHGKDYFAFFEQQGKLDYYILLDKGRVAGMVAAILKKIHSPIGLKKIWYYCDLKIHPEYRGRHLPIKMAYKIYLRNIFKSWNGYAISMNPAAGSHKNRVKLISRWLKWIPVKTDTQLMLFSLDKNAMMNALPILEKYRGKIEFNTLEGVKDLILTHDNSRIPILHAQFGALEKKNGAINSPQADHLHMFCAPEEDPLVKELSKIQIKPSSTMTLFNCGTIPKHWSWLLTSDL